VDVVISYLHTKNNGEELRYALRSIHRNVLWPRKVWVVGDREDWFSDELGFLQVNQLPKGIPHRRVRDGAHKVLTWGELPDAAPFFVWWYDDVYAMKPTELSDIFPAPSAGRVTQEAVDNWKVLQPWRHWKKDTFKAILKQGITPWDMTTHLPQMFNVVLLKAVTEEYPLIDGNLPQLTYAADLHFNTGTTPPPISDGLRFRVHLKKEMPTLEEAMSCKIMCPMNGLWYKKDFRNLVKGVFPDPSPYEKVEEVIAA